MKRFAARKPVFAPSPQALAERGANALRQGQFKDATEIFKQLSREDPRAEWTQRLGDAYAGRARALAEKGMYKEAAIVLENTLVARRHDPRATVVRVVPGSAESAAEGAARGARRNGAAVPG